MLRAVSTIYIECQVPELLFSKRRDVLKVFRVAVHKSSAPGSQTVLMSPRSAGEAATPAPVSGAALPVPPLGEDPPTVNSGPPPRSKPVWTLAAALALTASLGGAYLYNKKDLPKNDQPPGDKSKGAASAATAAATAVHKPDPDQARLLPERVEFLVAGGGTAGFAALRALRAARPGSRILVVAQEPTPPYMRPPLSKEVWREPNAILQPVDSVTFRQWSGRRRALLFEPREFYSAVEDLKQTKPHAALLALGWKVDVLDVDKKIAYLRAGDQLATVKYENCLLATGSVAKELPCLQAAASAGRAFTLRSLEDASNIAKALESARNVTVIGGGLEGCELAAALASTGANVTLAIRGDAPLEHLLPRHLAADASRALTASGVILRPNSDVKDCKLTSSGVDLIMKDADILQADLVVQCIGAEPNVSIAKKSGLEIDPNTGGIVVDASLRAYPGVYVAGDAASFYWRRAGGVTNAVTGEVRGPTGSRVLAAHHDHAVRSGRAAATNMAGQLPETPYDYQPMFWTDLGPDVGFEAVGIIDSRLPTVSVFADDAVSNLRDGASEALNSSEPGVKSTRNLTPVVAAAPNETPLAQEPEEPELPPSPCKYSRGVVFYMDGKMVVGVLLWNVFNRVQMATQVLAQGEFDDLVEVAKLFNTRES